MERRMKGGYLDQRVPYTFCSVSAAPASTPAPAPHPAPTAPQSPPGGSQWGPGRPSPEPPLDPTPKLDSLG